MGDRASKPAYNVNGSEQMPDATPLSNRPRLEPCPPILLCPLRRRSSCAEPTSQLLVRRALLQRLNTRRQQAELPPRPRPTLALSLVTHQCIGKLPRPKATLTSLAANPATAKLVDSKKQCVLCFFDDSVSPESRVRELEHSPLLDHIYRKHFVKQTGSGHA